MLTELGLGGGGQGAVALGQGQIAGALVMRESLRHAAHSDEGIGQLVMGVGESGAGLQGFLK